MAQYIVKADGFIAMNHYKAGDTIELSDAEAKYLLLSKQIEAPKGTAPKEIKKDARAR